jgi:hypothetical protein
MGRGGGEGRVPSLMTDAVEREVSDSYLFSFFFDVSSMGHYTRVKQNTLCFTQKDTKPSQTCSGGHITPNPTQNRCG